MLKEYINSPALSYSSCKNLLIDYATYLYAKNNRKEPTQAMQFGSAVHKAILEPDLFESEYKVFDGYKRGKEYENFLKDNENAKILSSDEFNKIITIRDKLMNSEYGVLFENSINEKPIFCEIFGEPFKALPDSYNPKLEVITDLKTIGTQTTERALVNAVYDNKYYIQEYIYTKAVESNYNVMLPDFKFIFLSTNEPFEINCITLDYKWSERAKSDIKQAIETFRAKNENNVYRKILDLPTYLR